MNETIPDKEAHQTNHRRMCWAALGMMIACTAATIYDPVRMFEADSILMAQYLALSGLVGAYLALGKKKWSPMHFASRYMDRTSANWRF